MPISHDHVCECIILKCLDKLHYGYTKTFSSVPVLKEKTDYLAALRKSFKHKHDHDLLIWPWQNKQMMGESNQNIHFYASFKGQIHPYNIIQSIET